MVEERREPAAAARSPSRTSARRSERARAAFGLLGCGFFSETAVSYPAGLCLSDETFFLFTSCTHFHDTSFSADLFPFCVRVL